MNGAPATRAEELLPFPPPEVEPPEVVPLAALEMVSLVLGLGKVLFVVVST